MEDPGRPLGRVRSRSADRGPVAARGHRDRGRSVQASRADGSRAFSARRRSTPAPKGRSAMRSMRRASAASRSRSMPRRASSSFRRSCAVTAVRRSNGSTRSARSGPDTIIGHCIFLNDHPVAALAARQRFRASARQRRAGRALPGRIRPARHRTQHAQSLREGGHPMRHRHGQLSRTTCSMSCGWPVTPAASSPEASRRLDPRRLHGRDGGRRRHDPPARSRTAGASAARRISRSST